MYFKYLLNLYTFQAQDPDTLKSALKALTACTQINELSRSQVVDYKGIFQ